MNTADSRVWNLTVEHSRLAKNARGPRTALALTALMVAGFAVAALYAYLISGKSAELGAVTFTALGLILCPFLLGLLLTSDWAGAISVSVSEAELTFRLAGDRIYRLPWDDASFRLTIIDYHERADRTPDLPLVIIRYPRANQTSVPVEVLEAILGAARSKGLIVSATVINAKPGYVTRKIELRAAPSSPRTVP